ncbi:MAG: DUF952 domain-containing protein [Pseudomonadota bacterium]
MLQRTFVYKILSAADWQLSETLGYTQTELDEADGYVHLSTRAQVAETLTLHYSRQKDVRLLEYVVEEMGSPVRWEESRGGQLFPHLYSTLRIDAAKRTWILTLGQDGAPTLPDDIDT